MKTKIKPVVNPTKAKARDFVGLVTILHGKIHLYNKGNMLFASYLGK